MNEEQFKKLLFKAMLGGNKKVGELMIDLLHAGEQQHAYSIHKTYCPGAIEPPDPECLSIDHSCDWSPYGYCYSNELGRNIEHMDPDSRVCIWCEKIWAPPNMIELTIDFNYYDLRFGELHRE